MWPQWAAGKWRGERAQFDVESDWQAGSTAPWAGFVAPGQQRGIGVGQLFPLPFSTVPPLVWQKLSFISIPSSLNLRPHACGPLEILGNKNLPKATSISQLKLLTLSFPPSTGSIYTWHPFIIPCIGVEVQGSYTYVYSCSHNPWFAVKTIWKGIHLNPTARGTKTRVSYDRPRRKTLCADRWQGQTNNLALKFKH